MASLNRLAALQQKPRKINICAYKCKLEQTSALKKDMRIKLNLWAGVY